MVVHFTVINLVLLMIPSFSKIVSTFISCFSIIHSAAISIQAVSSRTYRKIHTYLIRYLTTTMSIRQQRNLIISIFNDIKNQELEQWLATMLATKTTWTITPEEISKFRKLLDSNRGPRGRSLHKIGKRRKRLNTYERDLLNRFRERCTHDSQGE